MNRRARRTKTDRIDALKLVMMLVRVCCGERASSPRSACRRRTRRRGRSVASARRWRRSRRGCAIRSAAGWRRAGAAWRRGRPAGLVDAVPVIGRAPCCRRRCKRGSRAQRRGWRSSPTSSRRSRRAEGDGAAADPQSALARLVQLKGVATTSASVLLDEGVVWRAFQNRRQIGGLLGFAPAKYDSGESERDQGIVRAGNTRLQSVMVQLAWGWVHWQPQSALTRWYRSALARGNARAASASLPSRASC